MRVTHLSLQTFRNYLTADAVLSAGKSLIYGSNGQGKTNLVEAIELLSMGRSHRVSSDQPLIHAEADSAIIRALAQVGEREARLELELNRNGPNRAQAQGQKVRPSELSRWLTSVSCVPEDLGLVRGEPALRRRFLDDALVARFPAAAGTIADYDRAVKQRTALLKSARANGAADISSTLALWDAPLIEHGARIMHARRALLRDLAEPLSQAYFQLVGADHKPTLGIAESTSVSGDVSRETLSPLDELAIVSRETIASQMRASLDQARPKELERGVTLIGPHRDDVVFGLNGLPVKGYASHGESWSFVLSLKLALAGLLRTESNTGDPILILDDVFSELDDDRRARLFDAVGDYEQVIVTAASEQDVPEDPNWHRVRVSGGVVLQ